MRTASAGSSPGEEARHKSQTCVLVLGSGRSGTSVFTHLLANLGVQMSNTLSAAGEQNPVGFYEDLHIVNYHKRIFECDGLDDLTPIDVDRISNLDKIRRDLDEYIMINVSKHGVWGFKDPRSAFFLPIYRKIFNRNKIVPRYILCVRDPRSVVESLSSNFGHSQQAGELLWLSRNLAALRETHLGCFIAHYEDLLEDPISLAESLSRFVFDGPVPIDKETVSAVVQTPLNRSALNQVTINNPLVKSLYAALKGCRGYTFDRTSLREVVSDLSAIESTFLPWAYRGARVASMLRKRMGMLAEATHATGQSSSMAGEAQLAPSKEQTTAFESDGSRSSAEFVVLRGLVEECRERVLTLEDKVRRMQNERKGGKVDPA